MLASGCVGPFAGKPAPTNSVFCRVDEPIGFATEDTEETKQRIVEHDRRLYCLCPEQYPKMHSKMECPEQ